jgi:hypothetical protein
MPWERTGSTNTIRLSLSHVCAIARRCGGRDDEEDDIFCRPIAEAVFKVWLHMNALSGSEGDRVAGEFKRRSAREHIEELARVRVKVSDLSGARRHTLLNDTEIRALKKMPTVANGSPRVVLSARPINRHQFGGHFGFLLEWRLRAPRCRGRLLDRTFSRVGQDPLYQRPVYASWADEAEAGRRLDWLIEQSRQEGCDEVHLDTGFMRHAAHPLYLSKGRDFSCHHLSKQFSNRHAFAMASTTAPGLRPGSVAPQVPQ